MPPPPHEPLPGEGVIEIVDPPPTTINGVAGKPTTWCWATACVDGVASGPDGLPIISSPFEVRLPDGAQIEAVSAYLDRPGAPVQVTWEGTEIGPVPEGTVMLNVFVRLAPNGDASYYWAIVGSE
jgi:hypothetical protein